MATTFNNVQPALEFCDGILASGCQHKLPTSQYEKQLAKSKPKLAWLSTSFLAYYMLSVPHV